MPGKRSLPVMLGAEAAPIKLIRTAWPVDVVEMPGEPEREGLGVFEVLGGDVLEVLESGSFPRAHDISWPVGEDQGAGGTIDNTTSLGVKKMAPPGTRARKRTEGLVFPTLGSNERGSLPMSSGLGLAGLLAVFALTTGVEERPGAVSNA